MPAEPARPLKLPPASALGAVTVAGFYSYGEIGPYGTNCHARLHNQTMTVSLITEKV